MPVVSFAIGDCELELMAPAPSIHIEVGSHVLVCCRFAANPAFDASTPFADLGDAFSDSAWPSAWLLGEVGSDLGDKTRRPDM